MSNNNSGSLAYSDSTVIYTHNSNDKPKIIITYNLNNSQITSDYRLTDSLKGQLSYQFYHSFYRINLFMRDFNLPLDPFIVHVTTELFNLIDIQPSLVVEILNRIIDNNKYSFHDIMDVVDKIFVNNHAPYYIDQWGRGYRRTSDPEFEQIYIPFRQKLATIRLSGKSLEELLEEAGIDEYPIKLIHEISSLIKCRLVLNNRQVVLLSPTDVNINKTLNSFASLGQTTFEMPRNKHWSPEVIDAWLSNDPYDTLLKEKKPALLDDWISLYSLLDFMGNENSLVNVTNDLERNNKYLVLENLPKNIKDKIKKHFPDVYL